LNNFDILLAATVYSMVYCSSLCFVWLYRVLCV